MPNKQCCSLIMHRQFIIIILDRKLGENTRECRLENCLSINYCNNSESKNHNTYHTSSFTLSVEATNDHNNLGNTYDNKYTKCPAKCRVGFLELKMH